MISYPLKFRISVIEGKCPKLAALVPLSFGDEAEVSAFEDSSIG